MDRETYVSLYTSIETVSSKMSIHKGKEKGLSLLNAILIPIIRDGERGSALQLLWFTLKNHV